MEDPIMGGFSLPLSSTAIYMAFSLTPGDYYNRSVVEFHISKHKIVGFLHKNCFSNPANRLT